MTDSMVEIRAIHFSHKRAIMYHDVMIEWLLLESLATSHVTHFFDDKHTFYWPEGTFTQTNGPDGQLIDIASRHALATYRQQFVAREQAYQAYLAQQDSV